MSALSLVNLCKNYGATKMLKGVDLALDSGEFLVLLGPSGCGKSTILNIIAGLLEPTEGDVRIGDHSVIGVHPKHRDIAMVFQSYALYPNLTVARNIGFGLEMRRVPRAQRDIAIARVAETLQITSLLGRYPAALSGGQRQRVAIGRALVRDPAVFLFDEPLSNLDAKLRLETRAEIKRLHQSLGKTMVYVTHDQIEAMTLATRIAVLRDGRIEQFGTPEDIYLRPATLFVAQFVGSPGMNLLPGRVSNDGILLEGSNVLLPLDSFSRGNWRDIPQGSKVVIGVRPENVNFIDPVTGGLSAEVELVELTGPEKIVTLRATELRLQASVSPRTNLKPGQIVNLKFSPESTVLFDAQSGKRLD